MSLLNIISTQAHMFPKLKTINERFIKAAADQRLINTASDGARPMDKAQLKMGTTFRTC